MTPEVQICSSDTLDLLLGCTFGPWLRLLCLRDSGFHHQTTMIKFNTKLCFYKYHSNHYSIWFWLSPLALHLVVHGSGISHV